MEISSYGVRVVGFIGDHLGAAHVGGRLGILVTNMVEIV